MDTELEAQMINKIFTEQDINVYNFTYRNDQSLMSMLSDFEEIAWVNRPNGFKEGVIKTTNLKNLNLENRHLYVSFISEINSYLKEKSLSFAFPIENLFIKILPETSYSQQFLNPGLIDTVSVLYVANDNHTESKITFLNKDISIPLEKGNLIIFKSSEDYSYSVGQVNTGELILGISYVEVENA
jgi:predicted nuclease of predicted toxin-antitoxin system